MIDGLSRVFGLVWECVVEEKGNIGARKVGPENRARNQAIFHNGRDGV
jgi:hypothetical protein